MATKPTRKTTAKRTGPSKKLLATSGISMDRTELLNAVAGWIDQTVGERQSSLVRITTAPDCLILRAIS